MSYTDRIGDKNRKTVWWHEGWEAFDEFQRDDNPYSEKSDKTKHEDWLDGYNEAIYEKYRM